MRQKARFYPASRLPGAAKVVTAMAVFWLCSLIGANCRAGTEEDLRDAVLERKTFTQEQINAMDLNTDGKLDAADLVSVLGPSTIVNFVQADTEAYETAGTVSVTVNFSESISTTLKYIVGGTATSGEDYQALSGSLDVNGNNATLQVPIIADTTFEGDEQIWLILLPAAAYQLGTQAEHKITLKDNPNETTGNYLFVLNRKTMGVEGSPEEFKGFPETVLCRKASVALTFSATNILAATLNLSRSIGLPKCVTDAETISAKSVSYDSGKIEMAFEYDIQSRSFVTDGSITSFDAKNPSLGVQTPKPLKSDLVLTIVNFDLAKKFSEEQIVEGEFSLTLSGVLQNDTGPLVEGTLLGMIQR